MWIVVALGAFFLAVVGLLAWSVLKAGSDADDALDALHDHPGGL